MPNIRVVDAHTGRTLQVGDTVPMPGGLAAGWYRVEQIDPGLTFLWFVIKRPRIRVASSNAQIDGQWMPLVPRFTHPAFPGEYVGFVAS